MPLTIKLNLLPHNSTLSFVLFVKRNLNFRSVDVLSLYISDEILELFALAVQPVFEDCPLNVLYDL